MLLRYAYLVSVHEDPADREDPKGDQDWDSPGGVDAKSDPDQAEQGEAHQRQVSQARNPIAPEIHPEHKVQQGFCEHVKENQAERQQGPYTPSLCQVAGKDQGQKHCQEQPQNADHPGSLDHAHLWA